MIADVGRGAGLLRELAQRGRQRLLLGVVLALGDRPRAGVLLGPERAAGVHQQHLEGGARAAVQENAGAAFRHPRIVTG